MAENSQQEDALFVNLVLMFQAAAMQQMGKVANPLTGKVDKNLDQARFSIDMIEMLKGKTSGNLSPDLEKLLGSTLTNLRLNYVDEMDKAAKERDEKQDEVEPEGEAADQAATGEGVSQDGDSGGTGGEGSAQNGGGPPEETSKESGIQQEGDGKDGS
jgi:hypothetical protein